MDACCVVVDIDSDDHLNPLNMRFSVFVGLVGEYSVQRVEHHKEDNKVGVASAVVSTCYLRHDCK